MCLNKLPMFAFNRITFDSPGSDCGTDKTIKIRITENNYNSFLYSKIDNNGVVVTLTEDVITKFIGKEVDLYSIIYCKGEKICNKCAGDIFYLTGEYTGIDIPVVKII